MLELKTIKQFAQDSGYSERAIRSKIYEGIWGEGITFKAPDGRRLISTTGVENWVTGNVNTKESNKSLTPPLGSISPTSEEVGEKLNQLRQEMMT